MNYSEVRCSYSGLNLSRWNSLTSLDPTFLRVFRRNWKFKSNAALLVILAFISSAFLSLAYVRNFLITFATVYPGHVHRMLWQSSRKFCSSGCCAVWNFIVLNPYTVHQWQKCKSFCSKICLLGVSIQVKFVASIYPSLFSLTSPFLRQVFLLNLSDRLRDTFPRSSHFGPERIYITISQNKMKGGQSLHAPKIRWRNPVRQLPVLVHPDLLGTRTKAFPTIRDAKAFEVDLRQLRCISRWAFPNIPGLTWCQR